MGYQLAEGVSRQLKAIGVDFLRECSQAADIDVGNQRVPPPQLFKKHPLLLSKKHVVPTVQANNARSRFTTQ